MNSLGRLARTVGKWRRCGPLPPAPNPLRIAAACGGQRHRFQFGVGYASVYWLARAGGAAVPRMNNVCAPLPTDCARVFARCFLNNRCTHVDVWVPCDASCARSPRRHGNDNNPAGVHAARDAGTGSGAAALTHAGAKKDSLAACRTCDLPRDGAADRYCSRCGTEFPAADSAKEVRICVMLVLRLLVRRSVARTV